MIRTHKADLLEALPTVAGDQPGGDERLAELRRLVEAIARANSVYWTSADIEEAVAVGSVDLDNALTTFRAIATGYGVAPDRDGLAQGSRSLNGTRSGRELIHGANAEE